MSSHDTEELVRDALMQRRTIPIVGEINKKSVGDALERMFKLQLQSNEPITLMIDSGGGNTYEALRLCDYMKLVLSVPFHAYVVGTCMSSATFILLSCEVRVGTPHARFLVHNGRYDGSSFSHSNMDAELEACRREIRKTEDLVVAFYESALGKGKPEVRAMMARGDGKFDDYLTAYEALSAGLIDKILDGKIGVFDE